jgi:hypothetical protein
VNFLQGLGEKCTAQGHDFFQPFFGSFCGLNLHVRGPAKGMNIKGASVSKASSFGHRKW